ncbi:DNA polymerase IV (plasmid) [Sinorhizobium kummerowiae]|uniref:DNA polymerase IV n=1 Tax=Sinorhizobium kummerowiae TaxID=158892 RepID=A0ABY8TFD8_9HYPH|nr:MULTISPECIES: DNA polymerase IV [Sinorhizobium]WHS95970.1 DNA polymerase IV [Sinorhizobium kummerowiae]
MTNDEGSERPRKIVHVDMDAFYASVEQRDNPDLRGLPVAVGYPAARGVVAAASYEARKFGVHSAMASVIAKRKCPDLIFVKPRFEGYKAISLQIRAIFAEYTPMIEPLSLDEAYLDVSEILKGTEIATVIAQEIRAKIKATTELSASAGISYNKFLAKMASGQNKPDGQFVITPKNGPACRAASDQEVSRRRARHSRKDASAWDRNTRRPQGADARVSGGAFRGVGAMFLRYCPWYQGGPGAKIRRRGRHVPPRISIPLRRLAKVFSR